MLEIEFNSTTDRDLSTCARYDVSPPLARCFCCYAHLIRSAAIGQLDAMFVFAVFVHQYRHTNTTGLSEAIIHLVGRAGGLST